MTTKIEWTKSDDGSQGLTWNPVIGCSKLSAGCANCYAVTMANRLSANPKTPQYKGLTRDARTWTGETRLVENELLKPFKWRTPRRIFVGSMTDMFHEATPDEWRDKVFAVAALCPQHTFLFLTKRAAKMREYNSDKQTPYRIAKAMDALRSELEKPDEVIAPIAGFPGYFISNHGRVLTNSGSSTCVYCGGAIPTGKIAKAKYCSKKCRQNGGYRTTTGQAMPYPSSLSEMSPDATESGHRRILLYKNGATERRLVHRLVLETFVGAAPEANMECLHRDGDPSNNAISNLSWGTSADNHDDRKRHGTHFGYRKLTDDQVLEIRTRHAAGENGDALGKVFGVSGTQIRNIVSEKQRNTYWTIDWPIKNCWSGVTCEDQEAANERIPLLLRTPAAVRFISAEPLLGELDLAHIVNGVHRINALTGERYEWHGGVFNRKTGPRLDQAIVGAETGPRKRPMERHWAYDLRDQCVSAGVPFFLKKGPDGERELDGKRW